MWLWWKKVINRVFCIMFFVSLSGVTLFLYFKMPFMIFMSCALSVISWKVCMLTNGTMKDQ